MKLLPHLLKDILARITTKLHGIKSRDIDFSDQKLVRNYQKKKHSYGNFKFANTSFEIKTK